jgi:hypothetical protein
MDENGDLISLLTPKSGDFGFRDAPVNQIYFQVSRHELGSPAWMKMAI